VTSGASIATETIDVASIVARIACRHDKPIAWARDHRAFLSTAPPDVHIAVEYEDRQHDLAWIADGTVVDAPEVSRDGGDTRVRTAYYDARLARHGHVAVRIQPGFGVNGLMRTLWTLFFARREALLLRARRTLQDGRSTVVVSDDGAGYVAVARERGAWVSYATPFDGASADTNAGAVLESVRMETRDVARTTSRAEALTTLAARALVVDRGPAALGHVLDVLTGLVTAVPCTLDVPRALPAGADALA
jgi:hypothetical protein